MDEIPVAILCGGAGTRLGSLTANTPKPLLKVGDRPFLDHLLFEIGRYGFRKVILLAGYKGTAVAEFAAQSAAARRFDLTLEVSIEPEPLGSGGALKFAGGLLADEFLLLNGDTWFEVNYHALLQRRRDAGADAAMAVHRVEASDRYGVVDFDGTRISRFSRVPSGSDASYVNGGVVACSRSVVWRAALPSSLEQDVWPALAKEGKIAGLVSDGYFLDIGVPSAFERSQMEIPKRIIRPAIFFDSSVLIEAASSSSPDRLRWTADAIKAIRLCNDHGCYAFVVQSAEKNNAGSAEAFNRLNQGMQAALACGGVHVDDWCGFPRDGGQVSARRRSATHDVVADLLARWPIDKSRSVLICPPGANEAEAAVCGISLRRFAAGSLMDAVAPYLCSGRERI